MQDKDKFNHGADLRSVAGKLIRSTMVVTLARRDVGIALGIANAIAAALHP